MFPYIRQYVKVAGFCAEPAAMPFLWYSHAGACIDAGRYSYFYLFGLWRYALTVAKRARLPAAPRALTVGAGLRKLQSAAGPHDLARAVASRTLDHRATGVACALAS